MMMRWDTSTKLALATACTLSICAPGALAQSSRDLAPIIYKTPDAPQPQSAAVAQTSGAGAYAPVQPQAAAQTSERPRIEFRYPDQPNRVYSGGEVRAADASDPMVFSSSTAAISPEDAREYAYLDTPAPTPPASDPAITTGGFDARATAARIAAQRDTAPPPSSSRPAADTYSLPGTIHQPAQVAAYDETGIASWYGPGYQGQPTANGEIYDQNTLTAAHPTLPLPSLVQVINMENGREIVVRVNDRGPFVEGRMIDLSMKAADMLGFKDAGEAEVRVRYLGPAAVQAAPQEPRWVADTVETPARPVTEVELPGLSETIAPAPTAPVARTQTPPVLQPAPRYTPSATPTGDFYVQVGSFANIGNAERLSRSLDASLAVKVVPARVNNADYFRVWVGPYGSHMQADQVRNDMSRRGVANGVVVSGR